MSYPSTIPLVTVTLVVATLLSTSTAAAASCESLAKLKLAHGRVTMAQPIAAGAFTESGGQQGGAQITDLPPFCRVVATLTPTAASDIQIEVWLPASGWNGKFQAVGNGGWNGNIPTNALANGLRRGYATAGTDTGHQGAGGPWMRQPEKLVDYGHRAVHEMAVAAKAIITAFYESAPKRSYFTGCSGGGRQGLKAAQVHPDDFDGIVAGAPALNATGRAAFSISVAQNLRKEEGSYIPAEKYPAIHGAVLQACDALDGVKDGVIDNPRACRFDPKVLACTAGDSPSCLTPPQVEAARKMYEPLKNVRTGREIFPGLAFGSELGWATFGGRQPFENGIQMFQHMVFNDPNWDYRTLNFDEHMSLVDELERGLINARDSDLSAFAMTGGKLLMYHGWSDPQIPAASSVQYYEDVLKAMGSQAKDTARLFMVPGMNHCGGGPGATSFDMLTVLERWVEHGIAPIQIPASRIVDGKSIRTRPLCPYPQVATYNGAGSTGDAANFVCK
jgi:feruloyl esterase